MRSILHLGAVLCALLVCSTDLAAQTTIALRGGLSMATIGGSDAPSGFDSRTGLTVGGAVIFGVGDNVGLQLGAAYVQKGVTETEAGAEYEFSLDYIEVPLLLRFTIPAEGSILPHFVVGPAVSFEAKCEAAGSSEGASVALGCGAAGLATKSIDFGGIVGAGLDIGTSGSASLTLDVTYNIGLTSIDDSGDDDDVKNRAWSLVAGIAFPVG